MSKFIRFIKALALVWAALTMLLWPGELRAGNQDKNVQTIIHLLDYIARDYPAAVQQGAIINAGEYAEMKEFSQTTYRMAKQQPSIRNEKELLSGFQQLKDRTEEKSSAEIIAALAKNIKSEVINLTNYQVSPTQWPDLADGKKLYAINCASCHGTQGDGQGKLAKGLHPTPTNFLDSVLLREVSPFQAYNTIRLGIGGTAMRGFEELSDEEIWDLAFYVKSLRFQNAGMDSTTSEKLFSQAEADITLSDAATLNDQELLMKLAGSGGKVADKLTAIRLHLPDNSSLNSLQLAREYIAESLGAYRENAYDAARQKALAAYLEGIEPVEAQLRANDPRFTLAVEAQMLRLRKAIENRKPLDQVEKEAEASLAMISQAGKLIRDTELTFWLSLLLTASILLREGVEAFLIIAVILAIIRTSGTKKALPWLHGGWIIAILAGFLAWFFSGWILNISGRDREVMEGAVSLLAVVILIFVGSWLHNNSHAKQWKVFIEDKVNRLLNKERMIGLAFFSFMVVFREAFESVLFLRAISLETATEDQSAIGLGVVAAFAVIALLAVFFLRFSRKIPVRQLFRYSSWMITLLAVILIGKGIHAIQESGVFSVTDFPLDLRIDWLGVYPTMETVLSQVLLLAVILGLWYLNNRKIKLNG